MVPSASCPPPRTRVLDGVDLAVHPGEIIAVTGPNGAGKSTLLRHFNGLLQPLAGSVRISGQDIAGLPPGRVAADVGLLFQHPRDQLFERTAEREVGFGLPAAPGARPGSACVGRGGSAEAAGQHPAELSASRQRLLALATVLARRPALWPWTNRPSGWTGTAWRCWTAVRHAAAAGAAVVLVTHDLAYARSLAHRMCAWMPGRLHGGLSRSLGSPAAGEFPNDDRFQAAVRCGS